MVCVNYVMWATKGLQGEVCERLIALYMCLYCEGAGTW